jgi:spore coat protein U-like protein
MKTFKTFLLLFILSILFSPLSLWATDVTQNASFSVTLEPGCAIGTPPTLSLQYIGVADTSGPSDKFDLSSFCNNSLSYEIVVGAGNNASGGVRQAGMGGNYLKYRLYADSGRTTELGASSNNIISGTGTGGAATTSIYASVLVSDNYGKSIAVYTDAITVTYRW